MVMMDEFRRRKQFKDYHEAAAESQRDIAEKTTITKTAPFDMTTETLETKHKFRMSGEERHFEPKRDELFDPRDLTLIFIDSDSVSNVTSLSRVNHRRVLIFLGNGNGVVSYGKGKATEYEQAFDNAFKFAKKIMLCLDIEEIFTSPRPLAGRHNDFRIRILPQEIPNYWGNPTIWEMLKHTGFFHCRFICVSRKRDPYSLIYGFFNAVSKNRTPSQIATLTGHKLHREGYVHGVTNS